MKILIIGTRFAPIPPIKGGAIEGLIDKYLIHNSKSQKVEAVVYSALKRKEKFILKLNDYKNVEFRFIDDTPTYKIKCFLYGVARKIGKLIYKTEMHDEFINSVYLDLKKKNEISKYDKIIILNNLNNVLYICSRTKGKHILYLHNDYLNKETKNSLKILNKLDEVWCVSNFIKKRVDELSPVSKAKTIYNGTDIERFNKKISEKQIKETKQNYNIKENDFIVLYTGRIMKEKGVKELIKAFIGFSKNKKNTKLLIIGSPLKNNNNYYNELQEISKTHNDKIYFLGYKNHSFLERIYKITNVQVVPSVWNEAFGLTVVEGLSAKIPMIVSNAGGIPEIVNDECSITIERDKMEEELINALNRIYMMKKEEISHIKESAYKRAKEFSIEKFNENLEKEMLM